MLHSHQSDDSVKGGRERERGRRGGLGEEEMGKELRLLTDGCQRGAEVLLRTVRAPAVCECVSRCGWLYASICMFVHSKWGCVCV